MRRPRLALALLIGMAPLARADAIYQSASLAGPLVFDQFDPSLGTLDAVLYSIGANVRIDYRVTSHLTVIVSGPGRGFAEVDLGTPSGATLAFPATRTNIVGVAPGTNDYTFLVRSIGAEIGSLPDTGVLDAYEGPGTFAVPVTLSGFVSIPNFQTTTLGVGPATGYVALVYDYTPGVDPPDPAPEPASVWLLMAGMASILTSKSRRA